MEEQDLKALFDDIELIIYNDWPNEQKVDLLYQILAHLFLDVTKKERLYFSTLFSRIAFVADRKGIQGRDLFLIHRFRRAVQQMKRSDIEVDESLVRMGLLAIIKSIHYLYDTPPTSTIQSHLPDPQEFLIEEEHQVQKYYPKLRVVITEVMLDDYVLIGKLESRPLESITILLNLPGRNEIFNPNIEDLGQLKAIPINANLLQVEVDENQHYRPGAIVLEPDFLLDVTSIASTFKHYGTEPYLYLFKRFIPRSYSAALLMGNVANYFLDELVANGNINFKDLFSQVFNLYPLQFAHFTDEELLKFMRQCQVHFQNLKKVLKVLLPSVDIHADRSVLEPSFFSEHYGIQGRLDLFEYNPDQQKVNIVELKSGKTYLPNAYKINHSHYIQTLLYDLIVQSVYSNINTANYILYSYYSEDSLRHAPVIKSQQKEALFIRNQLLLFEKRLIALAPRSLHDLLMSIQSNHFPNVTGFDQAEIESFHSTYSTLSGIEKAMFIYYTRFIATEHHLAKIGIEGQERNNGMASLWLDSLSDKESKYEIFSHLRIQHLETPDDDTPILQLARTELTNPLANFRIGDIVILYPNTGESNAVLHHQIYKCVILNMDDEMVHIRLRNKQVNTVLFQKYGLWNLEKDILDSSYRGLYRGLYAFAGAPQRKRNLIMGLVPPASPDPDGLHLDWESELTNQQENVLVKALQAKDYFLLWGPPGSGKTSMMLKSMVRYLMDCTDNRILLLAYTNRAVDEICAAVESIREDIAHNYFRIGSRFSTASLYRTKLLQTCMQSIDSRSQLMEFIKSKRIVVGTIASVEGKREIFDLMPFDIAIIDEASQILDPQLMGLLVQVNKFILIGDHRQLPAVVAQTEEQSTVDNASLQQLGYLNMRDSLFERLYKKCAQQQWNWAYDILRIQGRMHKALMQFPSIQFYDGQLELLPGMKSLVDALQAKAPSSDRLAAALVQQRLIYIPTPTDHFRHTKTNQYEAEWVLKIIDSFRKIYEFNDLPWNPDTVGVITPYRAQIALIKNMLQEDGLNPDAFTIDTVERYQGGARDIIIFSVCTNYYRQFSSLISLSSEGVDRKLNVALTRARQQIILIGNPTLLKKNNTYQAWIEQAYHLPQDWTEEE